VRAWLFSGGTALGAVQVHTAEQLRARDGLPDLVAGVSVGSLTALLAAQDRLSRLRELWGTVKGAKWFQRIKVDFNLLDGIYTLAPLRRRIVPELDYPLRTELRVGLVDLRTKRYRSIRANAHDTETIADALIASSTQPGIHEESMWRGKKAADGGLIHVIPDPAPLARDDLRGWTIHAVLCTPASREHPPPKNQSVSAVARGLECLVDAVVAADVARLQTYARRGAVVWLYSPPQWPGDPFDATQRTIRYRLDEVGPEVWASGVRL